MGQFDDVPLQEPEVQPIPVPVPDPAQQKPNRHEKKKRDQPLQKPEVPPAPAQQKLNRREKNKTFATKPVVPKPKCKHQYLYEPEM